jgi:hypothetical protein
LADVRIFQIAHGSPLFAQGGAITSTPFRPIFTIIWYRLNDATQCFDSLRFAEIFVPLVFEPSFGFRYAAPVPVARFSLAADF